MENLTKTEIDPEQLKNLTSVADDSDFNINEYNDDPILEPLPNFHSIYGSTVDSLLLDNLISDVKWFHNLCVLNHSAPDNTSPGVAKIIDSLVTTGKYEAHNDYYKISAELDLVNNTYQMTFSPLFYSKESFEFLHIESGFTSESELHINNFKKEIFIKYPKTEN